MTIAWAAAGALLYWLALPPVNAWWLGWIALVPWSVLVIQPELKGKRPLAGIWLVAMFFWMATFYFIPLPHWSLWIGWPLLGAYLGLYVLGFVVAGRWLVHGWRFPVWAAVPVAWTGLELLRAHLFGGLGLALLGHTQYRQTAIIQLAEWGGAYLVSFVLAAVAALVALAIKWSAPRQKAGAALAAVAMVGAVLAIGSARWAICRPDSSEQARDNAVEGVIVQGSIDVVFASPEEHEQLTQEHLEHYRALAIKARRDFPRAQIQIWPESTFLALDLIPDPGEAGLTEGERRDHREYRTLFIDFWRYAVGWAPAEYLDPDAFADGIALLTGASSQNPVNQNAYNSVLLIDDQGQVLQRYLKNHCVPFGEYVPGAQWFPVLDRLHPYGRSLSFGQTPTAIEFAGVRLAPSICFESTVPHVIRRHVATLRGAGSPPDYLVNLTNDGWFFGTNCLDLHLACTVFRAVELRTPSIVSANTGLSAEIDRCGRILQEGPRRQSALLPITLRPGMAGGPTVYGTVGDWPWVVCAGIAVGAWIAALAQRRVRPGVIENRYTI